VGGGGGGDKVIKDEVAWLLFEKGAKFAQSDRRD
jgi:hypothetical protein